MPDTVTRDQRTPLVRFLHSRGLTVADAAAGLGLARKSVEMLAGGTVTPWPKVRRRFVEVYGIDPFGTDPRDAIADALDALDAGNIAQAVAVLRGALSPLDL